MLLSPQNNHFDTIQQPIVGEHGFGGNILIFKVKIEAAENNTEEEEEIPINLKRKTAGPLPEEVEARREEGRRGGKRKMVRLTKMIKPERGEGQESTEETSPVIIIIIQYLGR